MPKTKKLTVAGQFKVRDKRFCLACADAPGYNYIV